MPIIPIHINQAGVIARGTFNTDIQPTSAVTILAGSILTIDPSKKAASNINQNYDRLREAIRAGDVVSRTDGRLEVKKDITNQSPSGAWVIVSGKPGAGWLKWLIDGTPHYLDALRSPLRDAVIRDLRKSVSEISEDEPAYSSDADSQELLNALEDLLSEFSCENLLLARELVDEVAKSKRCHETLRPLLAQDSPPSPSSAKLGIGCDRDCKNKCNYEIWRACADSFWERVWWKRKPEGCLEDIWDVWIRRSLRATRAQQQQPPSGSWRVNDAQVSAMSERLYDFFIRDWGTVAGLDPTAFLTGPWKLLLEGLNDDASADPTLFWGTNGGTIYGRSQKLASLIGKYLMVDALLRKDFPAFKEPARLLPVVVDRMGTLQHLHDVAHFREFHRGSILRSWLYELQWDDYLTIQKAAKELADSRCCESPAIYELCHMW